MSNDFPDVPKVQSLSYYLSLGFLNDLTLIVEVFTRQQSMPKTNAMAHMQAEHNCQLHDITAHHESYQL